MPFLLLLFLSVAAPAVAQDQSLDFLRDLSDFQRLSSMLREDLNRRAFELLDRREAEIAALRTPEEVERRRRRVRRTILETLGGLPERTPLNARTVGVLERDGYRVEKVVFESQPGFPVTANLYLPANGSGPFPAILYPLGHEPGGKAYPVWQQMLGTLARKGYVALTWDPLGQGEREQFWDAELGRSRAGSSTVQHTILGAQALLVGDNVARYTIWDGMRALDYLLSRPEVDSARIGCSGNSGGGTHTAYLAALDDRIQAAAPSCYITSWRNLLQTIGPQDAEQCLPPFLAARLDHADFVLAFSPKPYRILSAIRDFFSITGARDAYAEARRIYDMEGAPENLAMTEADDGHGFSAPRRAAAYRWFARALKGRDDVEPETEIAPARAEDLRVTATGQVATSLEAADVWSLNNRRLDEIQAASSPLPADRAARRSELRRRILEKTAYEPPAGPPKTVPYGVIRRDGYRVEKLTYESEPGILVPALLFIPEGGPARKPAVIDVDDRGKSARAVEGGPIERLVREGRVVLAVDLRGRGETAAAEARTGSAFATWFGAYDSTMTALLIGRPLVGFRMRDIAAGIEMLAARDDVDPARLEAIGTGRAAVPLLHVAVLESRVGAVRLERAPLSYEAIVRSRAHQGVFDVVIPGVLKAYDLPELMEVLDPGPVVVDPLDPMGRPLTSEAAERLFGERARLEFIERP